jgi:hypothetical protein
MHAELAIEGHTIYDLKFLQNDVLSKTCDGNGKYRFLGSEMQSVKPRPCLIYCHHNQPLLLCKCI